MSAPNFECLVCGLRFSPFSSLQSKCSPCLKSLEDKARNEVTKLHDPVNSPVHYRGNGMEAIDVIEAFKLDYYLGNVVKYVLRSGKKGERSEDLSKAIWYLRRAIEKGA